MRARLSSMTVSFTLGSLAAFSAARSDAAMASLSAWSLASAERAGAGGAGSAACAALAASIVAAAAAMVRLASVFMSAILGVETQTILHNGRDGGPDFAARRRLELSLPRVPRASRPALVERLSDRSDSRRRLDDEAAARAVPGDARRLRLRRQRQDFSRRPVPGLQGESLADARRPGRADRTDRRSRQAARLA